MLFFFYEAIVVAIVGFEASSGLPCCLDVFLVRLFAKVAEFTRKGPKFYANLLQIRVSTPRPIRNIADLYEV